MIEEFHAPRDDLYRAMAGGVTAEDGRTITVRLAPPDQWAEIESVFEGHFMERFSRSAYKKTMADHLPKIMFQHGNDPQVGEKPIATTDEAGEDATSPYARGRILDGVPELVVAGLRSGVYGASHRFTVVRESWVNEPLGGTHNPDKLPERTITEAKLYELGPVTWPAYASASVSLRSTTDQYRTPPPPPVAPSLGAAAEEPHPEPERRDEPVTIAATQRKEATVPDITSYPTRDEKVARVGEIEREMQTLDAQFDGKMPDEPQARWNDYVAEKAKLLEAIDAVDARRRELAASMAARLSGGLSDGYSPPNIVKTRDLASIYDVQRITRESRNTADMSSKLRDAAMRAIDGAAFPQARFPKQSGQSDVALLLNGGRDGDQLDPDEVAKRVLYTGSPAYRRAFRKWLFGQAFTAEEVAAFEETRASLVTLSNTAVPFDLDTTMAIDTAGAVNPYREAFRVVKTTSNDWRPMVSSGMVAVYVGESTAGSEAAPAFTAPARLLQKAHTVAKFSTEIQSDYPGLEAELAREISDAKDVLESVQFTTGAGTTIYPQGVFTFWTANFLDTATTLVVVPKDLFAIEAWMGARYRANSVWLGSPYFYSLVRNIDYAAGGGGGASVWVDNLRLGGAVGNTTNNGRLGTLVGHPAYEVGGLPADMATTAKVAGLFNTERFVIIDRIGMNLELIPNFLSASTGYPTGERMVYAWWRNTACGIGTATLTTGEAGVIFRGK
jgi:HK97 family phage major capsid protein